MRRLGHILALLMLLTAASWAPAQNCCMPKLDDEDESSASLVEGIQAATALLIVVPVGLVSGIGYWMYRTYRKPEAKSPRSS